MTKIIGAKIFLIHYKKQKLFQPDFDPEVKLDAKRKFSELFNGSLNSPFIIVLRMLFSR